MLIDGIPAEQLVQRSVLDGLVQRPVNLQPTLEPDLRHELEDSIIAARRRMADRQKRELERRDQIRGMGAPGSLVIDGKTPAEISAAARLKGVVQARIKPKKIIPFEVAQARLIRQRKWTRESMQRLRAKRRISQRTEKEMETYADSQNSQN
jgi:hypothetical protein